MQELKHEIDQIKKRNQKVELEKAWETSITRKISIAILTYFVVIIFFLVANLPNPFINAIVPSLGFLLSTLSMGIIKNWWLKNLHK